MNQHHGIEVNGEFSPFLRLCIGVAIVLIAAGIAVWLSTAVIVALLG